ncbi:MAG: Hsp20/alpha crystallin family protein [Anaerolineae bacterium]|nr:MAG: Hsp20/alpha crystallin family protein [Anaerolineae bacterium]
MTEATIEKNMDVVKQEEKELIKRPVRQRTFSPRVDIYESNDNVVVLAEMPGVGESGIDITLEKNDLTIRGEFQHEELEGYKAAHIEYSTGNFERTFRLSDEVDRDNIEATIKNGLLTLVLPKAEIAKPKKIAVKSA